MAAPGVSVASHKLANEMVRRKVYAICLRDKRGKIEGVLMILDEKDEAEEIAFELRRKGQAVEVRTYIGSVEESE